MTPTRRAASPIARRSVYQPGPGTVAIEHYGPLPPELDEALEEALRALYKLLAQAQARVLVAGPWQAVEDALAGLAKAEAERELRAQEERSWARAARLGPFDETPYLPPMLAYPEPPPEPPPSWYWALWAAGPPLALLLAAGGIYLLVAWAGGG